MATAERIQTGDTEPITLDVRDAAGSPHTGATDIGVRIRRLSDGEYLDWDDSTFKAFGWTELDRTTVEQDAALAPGFYEVAGGFDTQALTNAVLDDTYTVLPVKGAAADTAAAVMPAPAELKVGQWVDAVGLDLVVTATIGSLAADTLRMAAWLMRKGVPVTTGLVSATIAFESATGTVIAPAAAMTGPTARGIFTRDVGAISLANATNYVTVVTITDARGIVTRYQAQPTVG